MVNKEKIVHKPWGKEVWLELNDKYCYKRIYINSGYKTSLQYHNNKLETNYLISGNAIFYLENDNGELNAIEMKEGDSITVHPLKKHQVHAITDIILQEVSTPEVDDVVRINDIYGREDGRIESEHMNPAFCILAAGIGSRMGSLTQHINKCLLPVNDKAIISHIIEKVPDNCDIIIAIGYKEEIVKSYVQTAHPNKNITFISVDKYTGIGSGPGYSILQCKHLLQRPFYFCVSDGWIEGEKFPDLYYNWLAINWQGPLAPEKYSTVDIDDHGKILKLVNKTNIKDGFTYAFIGLAGILNYDIFWQELEKNMNNGEIVSAFTNMDAYNTMKYEIMEWEDFGDLESYYNLSNNTILVKTDGSNTYFISDDVVKLFPNKELIKRKLERADILSKMSLIPSILHKSEYCFSYEKINGQTIYSASPEKHMIPFLNYMKLGYWNADISELEKSDIYEFYYNKPLSRLNTFLDLRNDTYLDEHLISENNKLPVKTGKIYDYLNFFKENWVDTWRGIPIKAFHGDLQFDNIITPSFMLRPSEDLYFLIDWRDSFGTSTVSGDLYYDLAKLYGGILIPYNEMKSSSNYNIHIMNEYTINYNYKLLDNKDILEKQFINWCTEKGYSIKDIKLITAYIYLSMAGMHEYDLSDILFFKSKLLFEEVKQWK